ncbi:hypothetical protein ACFV3R_02200 [Streptomyces sp. NPDC059740]|uniref:hypothetical protein n=1 Tax=Streptomyces sp. NPDC059740 TaxID=3346926 RepID=UPI003668CECC
MTDEIALDFDHAFRMTERLVEEGLLDRAALSDLGLINSIFDEMSGHENKDRWTPEALGRDPGWCAVRRLAQRVLDREGVHTSVLPTLRVHR